MCGITTPEGGGNIGRYLSPTVYAYVTPSMKSDKVTEYIINHKLFKTTQKKGDFVIKVNYIPIGFTEKFKELYNDLMKWKIDNAFKKSGEEPSDEKPKGDE